MGTHSRLSPSGSSRWMRCPGSVREEAKVEPRPSGPAAIDGTHTHTLLEHCVKNEVDPMLCVGHEFTDHEGAFFVAEDQAERVQVALTYLAERKAELGTCAVRSEENVDPGVMVSRDDMAGTLDLQIVTDDMLEIIDYKDGFGEVEVEGNTQLMTYGVGALVPYWDGEKFPFTQIRFTIIQPKMRDLGKEPITSHEMTLDELQQWAVNDLFPAAVATDDPEAPLIPGDVQCNWCSVKACKAKAEKALADAQVMFDGANLADQSAEQNANELTDEKLIEIYEAMPLIKSFLEGVQEELLARMQKGRTMGGKLKLVRGRGSSGWALSDEEMEKKLKGMGVPKAAVYTSKLVSPAQAKKLAWTKKNGDRKALSKTQIETLEKEYISKKQGKITVALASDSRSAVTTDAATLFADVGKEPLVHEIPDWMKAT